MWDRKLQLRDTDSSTAVTRGKKGRGWSKEKRVTCVVREDLTLGGGYDTGHVS